MSGKISNLARLYTIIRFSKSYICFSSPKSLFPAKSIYAMAFMEIVYMKLPFPSLKTKDEYIRFSKEAFRIHPMLLFRLQYPKIDIYDFQKRLIVYIVTVLTSSKAGNSIYKTSFFKIVYMCQLLPSCTDT